MSDSTVDERCADAFRSVEKIAEQAENSAARKDLREIRKVVDRIDSWLDEDGPNHARRIGDLSAATLERQLSILDQQKRTNDLLTRIHWHVMLAVVLLLIALLRFW